MIWVSVLAGAVCGVLSGFGIGGGSLLMVWMTAVLQMEQRTAQALYERLGRRLKTEKGWKQYIITSEPEFERHFGRKADKKRKLYNGMIQCNYYMYLGDMTKGRKK